MRRGGMRAGRRLRAELREAAESGEHRAEPARGGQAKMLPTRAEDEGSTYHRHEERLQSDL